MQRPLGKRREGSQRLDLVAEELDAHGLASRRGKDVHDSAPHCKLTALLCLLDALVAGKRQALRQSFHPGLVAETDTESLRTGVCGRNAFGKGHRGGADQASGCEDVAGARAFPDEVGRRLEAAGPANSPGCEEPDPCLAEKPAGALGRVASVGILGENADERLVSSRQVKGREEERQQRLRDAGVGRRRCELL
jgi:hypothetical protein